MNWQYFSARVVSAECGAVVKADAYGIGVTAVVKRLLEVGCQTFFVATMDEAIELRESVAGDYDIVVLGGQAANYHNECAHYALTPVLISFEQIKQWIKSAVNNVVFPIIKFDSGMHRFGLLPEHMDCLIENVDLLQTLSPSYFMSHLACADTPEHPLNQSQLSLFSRYYSQLKTSLPSLKASLANSSGCFLGSEYYFDLCRPGIGLYGGNPARSAVNPMQNVVELSLPIMQLKTINKGDSVGYGADYRAASAMRIAIVFGGYADGLFRLLSRSGRGFIGSQAVPMVGRVSMDAIAFDVSHIPDSSLHSENSIEILGEHQSVDELAAQANTISYEVLTSLGSRYHRHYVSALL